MTGASGRAQPRRCLPERRSAGGRANRERGGVRHRAGRGRAGDARRGPVHEERDADVSIEADRDVVPGAVVDAGEAVGRSRCLAVLDRCPQLADMARVGAQAYVPPAPAAARILLPGDRSRRRRRGDPRLEGEVAGACVEDAAPRIADQDAVVRAVEARGTIRVARERSLDRERDAVLVRAVARVRRSVGRDGSGGLAETPVPGRSSQLAPRPRSRCSSPPVPPLRARRRRARQARRRARPVVLLENDAWSPRGRRSSANAAEPPPLQLPRASIGPLLDECQSEFLRRPPSRGRRRDAPERGPR